MLKITKNEAQYLASRNFKWGSQLHHTYTKHKSYYATEDKPLMKVLRKYRKRNTLETYGGDQGNVLQHQR